MKNGLSSVYNTKQKPKVETLKHIYIRGTPIRKILQSNSFSSNISFHNKVAEDKSQKSATVYLHYISGYVRKDSEDL